MAIGHSITINEFINQCPKALRDWIEQDLKWEIKNIKEFIIEHQAFSSEDEYRKFKHGSLVDVSVTGYIEGAYQIRKHQFLQLPSGKWQKHKGWIQVCDVILPVIDWQLSYDAEMETKVENKEMRDIDAFDLMDSIREELWKI